MKNKSSNSAESYLKQLSAELHNLPADEREAILEEMRAHIESAAADNNFDETKLGNPSALAKGMESVYRPKRLVDYLLVVIPQTLILFVVGLVLSRFFASNIAFRWRIALEILLVLPIIGISLKRSSPELSLFWLATGVMLTAQGALLNPLTIGTEFSIGWWQNAISLGLFLWIGWLFGRTLNQQRDNPLLITWALLPFVISLSNLISQILAARLVETASLGQAYMMRSTVTLVATPMFYALFFLSKRYQLRWAALIGYGMLYSTLGVLMFRPNHTFHIAAFIPLIIIGCFFAWGLRGEWQRRRPWRFG